eukprot:gene14488-20512_t
MSRDLSLPPELETDLLLRAVRLGATLRTLSRVCRSWHSIVSQNLPCLVIVRHRDAMSKALCPALRRENQSHRNDSGPLAMACQVASRPQSVEDSNLALLLAALHGRADVVKILLHAPTHAARADNGSGMGLRNDPESYMHSQTRIEEILPERYLHHIPDPDERNVHLLLEQSIAVGKDKPGTSDLPQAPASAPRRNEHMLRELRIAVAKDKPGTSDLPQAPANAPRVHEA